MTPQELKLVLSSGLLSFPITDFHANGDFNKASYQKRLEWLAPYGASALFAAGGTGEFFSLESKEYSEIIKTAVDTCKGQVPILAGAGGPPGHCLCPGSRAPGRCRYPADAALPDRSQPARPGQSR